MRHIIGLIFQDDHMDVITLGDNNEPTMYLFLDKQSRLTQGRKYATKNIEFKALIIYPIISLLALLRL